MKVKPYRDMTIGGELVKKGDEVDVPQDVGCQLESRGLVQVITHDPPPKKVKPGQLIPQPQQEGDHGVDR